MKEILNQCKKFGEAQKFRSHVGECLIQDHGQNFFDSGPESAIFLYKI